VLSAPGHYVGEVRHVLVNGYSNGWLIPWKGSYELTVSYRPERLAHAARVIDLVLIPVIPTAALFGRRLRNLPPQAPSAVPLGARPTIETPRLGRAMNIALPATEGCAAYHRRIEETIDPRRSLLRVLLPDEQVQLDGDTLRSAENNVVLLKGILRDSVGDPGRLQEAGRGAGGALIEGLSQGGAGGAPLGWRGRCGRRPVRRRQVDGDHGDDGYAGDRREAADDQAPSRGRLRPGMAGAMGAVILCGWSFRLHWSTLDPADGDADDREALLAGSNR
jgi:hypothetical protein